MRHHGYTYKDPDQVGLDDWIVTEFRPLGEADHVRMVAEAHKVFAMASVRSESSAWVYVFSLDGAGSYAVEETAQVPVTDGPC